MHTTDLKIRLDFGDVKNVINASLGVLIIHVLTCYNMLQHRGVLKTTVLSERRQPLLSYICDSIYMKCPKHINLQIVGLWLLRSGKIKVSVDGS